MIYSLNRLLVKEKIECLGIDQLGLPKKIPLLRIATFFFIAFLALCLCCLRAPIGFKMAL